MTTLIIEFRKIKNDDATKHTTFYSNSKIETIINGTIIWSDIDDVIESVNTKIISNIQKHIGKGSAWITDSVISHTIGVSKYKPSAGSSYIKLPETLDHPRKGLINIQNINDNECFKWFLIRYLHPTDHNPKIIRKVHKLCGDNFDFKDIKFPVKEKKKDFHWHQR